MSSSYYSAHTPFRLLPWQILLLFYILGIIALRYPIPAVFLSGILFILQLNSGKTKISLFMGVCCLLLGYGIASYQFPDRSIPVPEWMSERDEVIISGVVDEVEPKPEDRIQIILSDVQFRTHNGSKGALPGKVVCKWESPNSWPSPGQRLRGEFRLEPVRGFQNPGTWENKFYWKKRGVFYRTYTKDTEANIELNAGNSFFWSLRMEIRENIVEHTPKGQGRGLLLALLMGDQSELSYNTLELVRRSSLAHSLAQSGLHLGFLITLAFGLAWLSGYIRPGIYLRISRPRLAILLALPLVLGYIWLGQARLSLLRASLMFFFWGLLLLRGRRNVLLDGLFFALVCILLLRPLDVFDISLQLSCLAVAGIILAWPLVYPFIKRISPDNWVGRWVVLPLAAILLISLIANIVLLPLTIWNFGRISFSIYTNLFWLPVIGWIVLPLGLLGILFGLLPAADIISAGCLYPAAIVLAHMFDFLQALEASGFVHSVVALRPIWPEMVGFWILLATGAIFWKRAAKFPWWLLVCAFVLISYPSVKRELSALSPQVQLQVLDVGQGQSVCMQFYKGKRILVDGGGSWNKGFDLGKFALAPALTYNRPPRLDKVVLTHSDYDHLRGLFYILKNFRVKEFIYNGNWPRGWDKRQLKSALQENGANRKVVSRGDEISLDLGCKLSILHPVRDTDLNHNNRSLVLRLTHKGRGIALIPGDLEDEGLYGLLDRDLSLQAELLLVPHHGSKKSLSKRLYSRVDPEIAIISCGYLNYYRLPHEKVLNSLERRNVPVYITSEQGQVRVIRDLSSGERNVHTYQGG